MKSGDSTSTSYGEGRVLLYREVDQIYVVQLPFGNLYCPRSTLVALPEPDNSSSTLGNTSVAMELNVAYEALENMRKFNLEVQCQEHNIPFSAADLDHHCGACMLARASSIVHVHSKKQQPKRSSSFSLLVRKSRDDGVKNNKRTTTSTKKSPPCLICGTPVCRKHASASFKKESITMCLSCEALFGMDYVVDILTSPDACQRRTHMDRMIDLYDRAVLLLRYSVQYIDDICASLQTAAVHQNRVGLGSSSAGIVSGVLGIVSCATIFTPVGPPLLIASLFFGGSATVAQTGAEVRNAYFFEPTKLADRVIALHGICRNILRVTGTLRDAILLDHLRTDLYPPPDDSDDNGENKRVMLTGSVLHPSPMSEYYQNHQADILARAGTLGSLSTVRALSTMAQGGKAVSSAAALETGVVASRGARLFGRTTSAALNSMQFIRIGGGALSAATLALEARNMSKTIKAIQAGNPCEKADSLRLIQSQILDLPETRAVDAECERYLAALAHRQRVMTEEEVSKLLLENAEILQEEKELAKLQESMSSSNGSCCDYEAAILDTSQQSTVSLRERIEMHKRNEGTSLSSEKSTLTTSSCAPKASLRERIVLQNQQEGSNLPPIISRESGVGGEETVEFTATAPAVENHA